MSNKAKMPAGYRMETLLGRDSLSPGKNLVESPCFSIPDLWGLDEKEHSRLGRGWMPEQSRWACIPTLPYSLYI